MIDTETKPRRRHKDEWTLPDDEIVQVSAPGIPSRVYGVGRFRAQVSQGTRTTIGGWSWRVWDVLSPSLGGSGFDEAGTAKTREAAINVALPVLRARIPRPATPAPSPGEAAR